MKCDFELKRLADFTKNGYAIAEAIRTGKGQEFLRAYSDNINDINSEIIESNPIMIPLISFFGILKLPADGLISDFHRSFLAYTKKRFDSYTVKHIPQSPTLLSRELKSCISSIEKKSIIIEFKRKADGQHIITKRIGESKKAVDNMSPKSNNADLPVVKAI
jgi:hypothetical protein